MSPSTINSINRLDETTKIEIYSQVIPPELLTRFKINPTYIDSHGNKLLVIQGPPDSSSVELYLYHRAGFPDPVLYGHLTDTLNAQVHILLYVMNDPDSPRFNVDHMQDGAPTKFGVFQRNLEVEEQAMKAGLTPGQIRRGLGMLGTAIKCFEKFIAGLGHDLYFAEPLHYHNAIIFERHGFAYQKGKKLMEEIQAGFSPSGDLLPLLDGSTPFRQPGAQNSIRLRSWAIHDGILGQPFNNVTMYKHLGKNAGVSTCGDCAW